MNKFFYILPICIEAFCRWICIKFCADVAIADVISCDKRFWRDRLRGDDSVWDQNVTFLVDQPSCH